jgi:hypothetical protein
VSESQNRTQKIVDIANYHHCCTHSLAQVVAGTVAERVKFMSTLHDIIARRPSTPRNKVGAPMITDFDKLAASPLEIAEAVLVTLGTIQPVKEVKP